MAISVASTPTFCQKLSAAIAQNQSLLCIGLDPSPKFLPWDKDQENGRSPLDSASPTTGAAQEEQESKNLKHAEAWLLRVIEETSDLVCAYKPTLDIYLSLGASGIALLERILKAIPAHIPVILDVKHGDWITSGLFSRTAFNRWQVDALNIVPFSGLNHAAPFLVYPDRAIFALCYAENPSAHLVKTPDGDQPYYLQLVEDVKTWGVATQLGLEVEGADPKIIGKIRQVAEQHPILVRGAWSTGATLQSLNYDGDLTEAQWQEVTLNLQGTLEQGLTPQGDGLIVLVPRSALNHAQPRQQVRNLRDRLNQAKNTLQRQAPADHCDLIVSDVPPTPQHPYADLIVQLYDLGCILFGDYVQSSGATFPYYVDLRQIISNPQIFQKILLAYGDKLRTLNFDRIAGIPYGSLPTATGLSLQLDRPMVFPRKEVKPHGTQRVVEGAFVPGETVAIVDDILISGHSVIRGAKKLESVGLNVKDIVVFINHDSAGVIDRLAKEGYRAHTVLSLREIAIVLYDAQRISKDQYETLTHLDEGPDKQPSQQPVVAA
ncbi:MAG: phosphoribosyltransferase family protein [Cyanobacteria bacterium P01_C01_bin.89]